MSQAWPRLVGDIGGTNARFALAETAGGSVRLHNPRRFVRSDFPTAMGAVEAYLEGAAPPACAVVAVAGPVIDGAFKATNSPWRLSESMLTSVGIGWAALINDYEGLALSLAHLEPGDLGRIGPDVPGEAGRSLGLLGAGTGLGVGCLARAHGNEAALATEGGHLAFAPSDEVEIEILRLLNAQFGRTSVERILSGPGLVSLRDVLGRIGGAEPEPISAEEIVTRAKAGGDPLCVETLDRFCAIYGSVAGDLALAFGARGGMFIGGGIAPEIVELMRAGPFRARFEAKGRFQHYLAAIPTQVILHPYAALLGAAHYRRGGG